MADQRNLRTHDAAGLNLNGIFYWHGCGHFFHKVNAKLNICMLQRLIGCCESRINLRLDILGLVNQAHQFPQQNIPLFIHQLIPLTGKSQRIFGQNQITLGRKCIRVHEVFSL